MEGGEGEKKSFQEHCAPATSPNELQQRPDSNNTRNKQNQPVQELEELWGHGIWRRNERNATLEDAKTSSTPSANLPGMVVVESS